MSVKRKRKNLSLLSRRKGGRLLVLKNSEGVVTTVARSKDSFANDQRAQVRRKLRRALKQTAADVQAENTLYRVPVTRLEQGQIVKVYPDGRREILKAELPPPVRITRAHFSLG